MIQEVAGFFDEAKVLELEPEILPGINWRLSSSAGGFLPSLWHVLSIIFYLLCLLRLQSSSFYFCLSCILFEIFQFFLSDIFQFWLHVTCDFDADDKTKAAEDRDELDQYPSLENNPVMFELRDEPMIPQLGVYWRISRSWECIDESPAAGSVLTNLCQLDWNLCFCWCLLRRCLLS